jgi:glutaredoxin 3
MARVEIYTKFLCPYCSRAKKLLDGKGVRYEEYEISMDPDKRQEMIRRADGRTTVPQIFIDESHVGGFDDLAELERAGRLDPMLQPG